MTWSDEVRSQVRHYRGLPLQTLSSPKRMIMDAFRRADAFAADHLLQGALMGPGLGQNSSPLPVPQRMVLLKPVQDLCNLACTYCYEMERRQKREQEVMDLETLQVVLEHLLPYVSQPYAVFVHGGEPLLAGYEFFVQLVERVKNHPAGEQITLGVQTNGTLIDEGWVNLFREHNVQVGISLDGPQQIHDRFRIGKNGHGSHHKVVRGIQLLQDGDVPFGVICLITGMDAGQSETPSQVFEHFVDLGIYHFDVHPAFTPVPSSSDFNVSPEDYAALMIGLFETWLDHGDPLVRVRSIDYFFQSMAGVPAQACYRSGKCTSIIGVDPSGEAVPCTRPFPTEYSFGNLTQLTLPELQQNGPFLNFVEDEQAGQEKTLNCRWSSACGKGGCPHDRVTGDDQDVMGRNVYCTCQNGGAGGYPAVFEYIENRVHEILG